MQAIATSEFAIDPADPHVARLRDASGMIAKITQKRAASSTKGLNDPEGTTVTGAGGAAAAATQSDADMSLLVGRLKRKQTKATEQPAGMKAGRGKGKRAKMT